VRCLFFEPGKLLPVLVVRVYVRVRVCLQPGVRSRPESQERTSTVLHVTPIPWDVVGLVLLNGSRVLRYHHHHGSFRIAFFLFRRIPGTQERRPDDTRQEHDI
jgi:hypothetical protein